jgi:transposase
MPKIGPVVREEICRTAKSDPTRLGCPFTCWSLTKLRDYLVEHKHIRLSREAIRQILKDARISWQNTKTWNARRTRSSRRRRTGSWSYTTIRHPMGE